VRKLVAFRMLTAVPQLALVSLLVFSITYLIPGSPAATILGFRATPAAIRELNHRLGLDKPYLERFGEWVSGIFHGDLGHSLTSGQAVTALISQRISVTLALTVGGIVVALVIGMLAGVLAAWRPGSLLDRALTVGSAIGLAIPQFWLGLILMLVFAVKLRWVPVISYTPMTVDPLAWLRGLVLPSIALGASVAALIARQMRNALVSALEAPYVDMLRSVGVPPRRIVLRFALKNAMVPVVAVTAAQVTTVLATSFVVEYLFGFPGLGTVLLSAVTSKDIPVVQGIVLLIAAMVIVVNLLADVLYGLLNPRARPL
jgi:peptide/nickel transport system permease protein